MWAMKVHGGPFQTAGVPDIVGVYQGRFFGIEVKAPGGKATVLQLLTIAAIRRAGGLAGIAFRVEDVECLLDLPGYKPRSSAVPAEQTTSDPKSST